jgi:membrane-associated protein
MELIGYLIDVVMHLDRHLNAVISAYGVWTYLILFLIIFCETGLVVMPLLPGDSLLFAVGNLAAMGPLRVEVLFALLTIAAVLGDTVNYTIGYRLGRRLLARDGRIFKRRYLERTERFYDRYGGKTIVMARFVPIVRTFAPFVAGTGKMDYGRFILYNVAGGVAWIAAFVFSGYFFGSLPVVKRNFPLVIAAIIVLSIVPGVIEYLRRRGSHA